MTAHTLNIVGLWLGFAGGLLMSFFPPRLRQYTTQGAAPFTWTTEPTRQWWGKAQVALAILAPVLLAVGFLFQLVSAYYGPKGGGR
jgi:hypothetical protein